MMALARRTISKCLSEAREFGSTRFVRHRTTAAGQVAIEELLDQLIVNAIDIEQ